MASEFFAALVLCSVACLAQGAVGRWPTVYQKIAQDRDLLHFNALLQADRNSKSSLLYREATVFAPTNDAFRRFRGRSDNVTGYHIVRYAHKLNDLVDAYLETINEDGPPLWVKRQRDGVYVNNALVLDELSDFESRTRQDRYGKDQVLHVIDEVLDPVARGAVSPTAYDFLSQTGLWTNRSVTNFFFKVIESHIDVLYRNEGRFTFFLPVDEGLTDARMQLVDAYTIKAHVVPDQVLFTRPTAKDYLFETLAYDDYIVVLVSMALENGKHFVRSKTILGDSNHQRGDLKVEILLPNIPVRNGVVHLVSRPLAVFDKKLSKFPYLPVWDKYSMDPTLNVSYHLGELSGFNDNFKVKKKFTFFAPRDRAWKRLKKRFDVGSLARPGNLPLAREILERHLIVSDVPFSMETLAASTSTVDCVNFTTPGGRTCLSAKEVAPKEYVLKWNGREVGVHRPDFECPDGIVHVVDALFMTDDDVSRLGKKSTISFVQVWNALHKFFL